MLSQLNACTICLLVLIFVTSAVTDESSSESTSSSEEQSAAKPVERQPKADSGSGDSDSDKSVEMGEGAGKITKAILREQAYDGDASSERRKKRHAFFPRAGNHVPRGE